jgi:hypothetical protein
MTIVADLSQPVPVIVKVRVLHELLLGLEYGPLPYRGDSEAVQSIIWG